MDGVSIEFEIYAVQRFFLLLFRTQHFFQSDVNFCDFRQTNDLDTEDKVNEYLVARIVYYLVVMPYVILIPAFVIFINRKMDFFMLANSK